MALTRIQPAAIADVREPNFRNIVINGDMAVSQRATSTASITTSGYHTIDRFQTSASSIGTWTQSQDTDVPTGQGFATSLKMDCTTADASPAASDNLIIIQKFEGQNLQYLKKGTASAESLTLSFWVKSNKTGTYIAGLHDRDNSRIISKSYTIDSSDTWEQKEITFAGDTTGAFDNDNAGSLDIQMWLAAGSDFSGGTLATTWQSQTNANRAVGQVNLADSTSNEFFITGVQLEAGSVATDFEVVPYDQNLDRCQRYYQFIASGTSKRWDLVSSARTTSYVDFVYPCTVPMRAQPSLDVVSGTDYYYVYSSNGGYDKFTTPAINSNYVSGTTLVTGYYSGGSYTAGDSLLASTDNASSYIALDAEL